MFPFAASLPASQLSGRFLGLGILLGELEMTKRYTITIPVLPLKNKQKQRKTVRKLPPEVVELPGK